MILSQSPWSPISACQLCLSDKKPVFLLSHSPFSNPLLLPLTTTTYFQSFSYNSQSLRFSRFSLLVLILFLVLWGFCWFVCVCMCVSCGSGYFPVFWFLSPSLVLPSTPSFPASSQLFMSVQSPPRISSLFQFIFLLCYSKYIVPIS